MPTRDQTIDAVRPRCTTRLILTPTPKETVAHRREPHHAPDKEAEGIVRDATHGKYMEIFLPYPR